MRRRYGLFAVAFALFAIYGSLVPFHFRALGIDRAWSQFFSTLTGPLRIDSHTDFLTNVLLFIPLGYLVGSSRVDLQACKLEYSIVSPK